MNLSDKQIESVKSWLADGYDVAQVQKQLLAEFGISMLYMDVRFLIDDIGASINVPEKTVQKPAEQKAQNASEVDGNAVENDDVSDDFDGNGQVQVALSPVTRPGAVAEGSVIFSDGGKAEWILDNSGQLGIIPETEGYNAPQADLPIFQSKLQSLMGMGDSTPSDTMEEPVDPNKNPVVVTMSKIQRPGCLAFGDVTFSDGTKAEWRIDQMGQLGLVPAVHGQNPPQSDMMEFQRKLQELLKTLY